MISTNLFRGQSVRLCASEPETMALAFTRWERDSEYIRLLDNDPPRMWSSKKFKEWIEKDLENEPLREHFFDVRTLETDQLIGFVGLWGLNWVQGDSFVGIGLGERDFWGKGYGSDAMRLILRYAFAELNLRRVSLNVFEYNTRGIRSYEKCGFHIEGRARQAMRRDGKRYDIIYMGILREEWQAADW